MMAPDGKGPLLNVHNATSPSPGTVKPGFRPWSDRDGLRETCPSHERTATVLLPTEVMIAIGLFDITHAFEACCFRASTISGLFDRSSAPRTSREACVCYGVIDRRRGLESVAIGPPGSQLPLPPSSKLRYDLFSLECHQVRYALRSSLTTIEVQSFDDAGRSEKTTGNRSGND